MRPVAALPMLALTAILVLGATATIAAPKPLAMTPPVSLDLSPDGRVLVAISNATDAKITRSGKARVLTIDTACLLAPMPKRDCETLTELDSPRARFGYWRPDERTFVVEAAHVFKGDYGAAPISLVATSPAPVADAHKVMRVDPASVPPLSGQAILDSEVRYLSSQGQTILRASSTNGVARLSWAGGGMILPPHLYDTGSLMPLRYDVVVKGDGSGFFIWSSSLGDHGLLLEGVNGKTRPVQLPELIGGPLQPVFTPSGRLAAAIFTPDALYGLQAHGRAVKIMQRRVRAARARRPDIELRRVTVSDDLKTWSLFFGAMDGSSELQVIRPLEGISRTVQIDAAGASTGGTSPTNIRSTFVDLGGSTARLPARLYASAAQGKPGKLVVVFHGGPPLDTTTTSHPWTRFLMGLGFDVLEADYRGSSGYGEAHLLALKAPAVPILLGDLETAAAWARRRGYATVGFLGTSAGGLAGIAAASAPDTGLDFIVLESPLIDWPPGVKIRDCARVVGEINDRLFGLTPAADGACSVRSTGIFDAKIHARTPIFMLQGQNDPRTPASLADRWTIAARESGACVTRVDSTKGGHTLTSWPKPDQEHARQALATWLSARGATVACPPSWP